MKGFVRYLNRVKNSGFKYPVVVFIILILALSPVGSYFVEIGESIETHTEDYSTGTSEELESEEIAQYGDPPTNHRTPAQRERAEKILMRWDWEYEDYHTDIALAISHEQEAVAEIIAEDDGEADDIEDELIDAGANMDNVEFVIMGEDTPGHQWIRDYGPVPIIDQDSGDISFINMEYRWGDDRQESNEFPQNYANEIGVDYYDMVNENGDWFVLDGGHKFVEGSGVFYTTDHAYDLNDDLGDEEDVEQWATEWFNLVENDEGFNVVSDDSYDHDLFHIDMQVNILNETTVVVSEFEDPSVDPDAAELLDETAEFFENQTVARSGESFDVERLPMHVESDWEGNTYYTHSNSLIVNDIVLVPIFNQGTDDDALSIYEDVLPDHDIIGIDSEDVAELGGCIHCTTREIPKANAPPSINITEIHAFENKNVTIEANITVDAGDEGMSSAHVYYNTTEMDNFEKVEMEHVGDVTYEADLGTFDEGTEFDYFIRVEDDYNAVSYDGDAWNPHTETLERVLSVQTQPTFDTNLDSAILYGELTDLEGYDEAEVYFEYKLEGEAEWENTTTEILEEPQSFLKEVSDLEEEQTYEFRAVAEAEENGQVETVKGNTSLFFTADWSRVKPHQLSDVSWMSDAKETYQVEETENNHLGLSREEVLIEEEVIENVNFSESEDPWVIEREGDGYTQWTSEEQYVEGGSIESWAEDGAVEEAYITQTFDDDAFGPDDVEGDLEFSAAYMIEVEDRDPDRVDINFEIRDDGDWNELFSHSGEDEIEWTEESITYSSTGEIDAIRAHIDLEADTHPTHDTDVWAYVDAISLTGDFWEKGDFYEEGYRISNSYQPELNYIDNNEIFWDPIEPGDTNVDVYYAVTEDDTAPSEDSEGWEQTTDGESFIEEGANISGDYLWFKQELTSDGTDTPLLENLTVWINGGIDEAIEGTVYDSDGNPVDHGQADLYETDDFESSIDTDDLSPNGTYIFRNLTAGNEYWVEITGVENHLNASGSQEVKSNTIHTLNFHLEAIKVEDIEVTEQPRLEYDSGENLDLSGMNITEYYTDETTETVTFGDTNWDANYTAEPKNGTELGGAHNGENITITHNPTGFTNETAELIINAVLENIEISTQPELEYYSGESLDLTGMEITEHHTYDTLTVTFGDTEWEKNYTAEPEHGVELEGSHHGDTISVTHENESLTTYTEELTVKHELTIDIEGEGSTDPEEGIHSYGHETDVNVQAIEDVSGYQFRYWTGDVPEGEEEEDTITITMDEDKSLTAHFLKEPSFEVQIVDHDEEVIEGEEFAVNYTVTNTGEINDTQDIMFTVSDKFDDEVHSDSENVELEGNEVHEGRFIWETEDEEELEDFSFKIETKDDGEEGEFLVFKEPYFRVTIEEPDDGEEYLEDDLVTVQYTIDNLGGLDDTQDIMFYVGFNRVDVKENLELGGDESYTGTFNWTAQEPYGERDLTVVSDDDDESVTILLLEEAYFEVEIIEPSEGEEYYEGQTVSVEYMVENTGDQEDTQDIEFAIDGDTIQIEEDLDLDGKEIHEGEFTWTATELGELTLQVESEDDQDDVTITVEEAPEEAFFDVYISAPEKNSEYFEGDTVTVEYEVKNLGQDTDTQDIEFYIDDDLIDTRDDLQLEGSDSYSGIFDWTTKEPFGERDLVVESEDHSNSVTIILLGDAFFEVEIIEPVEGEEYYEGQTVSVEYMVENTGDLTDTQDITFFVDGHTIQTEEDLELEGKGLYEGEFTWTATGTDVELSVESEDDEDSITITVIEPPEEAFFDVYISAPEKNSEYFEGDTVTVEYEVKNLGEETDTQDIVFQIDGDPIATEEGIELARDESYSGSFEWIAEEPFDERDLVVQSEDRLDSVTIIVPYFKVEILEPRDDQIYIEGEPVTVRFKVENTGTITNIQNIEFYIDEDRVDVELNLGLEGGEIYEGSFRWISEGPYGERDLKVQSENHHDEVTVIVLEDPYFEVTLREPTEGEEYIEGDTVTIEYYVENIGYVLGEQDIEVYIDGELINVAEEVKLGGGSSHSRELSWTAEEPYGERELLVKSEDDSSSVTITVLKDTFFEVEIVDYEDVVEGEEFSVSFEVENTGEVIGTQDIHYTIYDDDGNEIYSEIIENVELEEGEIFDEEFSWNSEDPGEYYLTITSEDDEEEVEFRVLKEAFFEININSPESGEEFVEGQEIVVNYTVTNTGEVEDTQTIEFTINGELENSLEVTLGEDEIFQSEFIWTPEEAGEYELKIASEAGNHQESSLSVEVGTPFSNYLPYLLLIIAAIVVIIGVVIYKAYLTKKEPVIEEVFLISKRNSMLILHNTRRLRPDRDSDIIAGMFEAVQNFIEDSFQDTGDWELNRLEFGGNNIVVEQGDYVYMAVVYEGELSKKNIQEIRDVIERIEDRFAEQLKEWDGDRKELRGIKDMTQDLFS